MDAVYRLKQQIESVFQSGIKPSKTIGGEFEHFIIHRDTLKSYDYYMDNGIKDILIKLKALGWTTNQPDSEILSLEKPYGLITLEPGGQIELSVYPMQTIEEVEKAYLDFIKDLRSVLLPEQAIVSVGFHPKSAIEEIPFIPKSRYKAMSEYFQGTGQLAHHMMKGTASTQVGIDYASEEDCGRKIRVFTLLAPLLAAYFDSGARWQGLTYSDYSLRTKIWMETDPQRSGAPNQVFNLPWRFSDYSDYVMSVPPILMQEGKEFWVTEKQALKEIVTWLPKQLNITEFTPTLVEHALTMVFPDVRLKRFLEVRMADALPYPHNFAVLELVWAIAYREEILQELFDWSLQLSPCDIAAIREAVVLKGLQAPLNGITIFEFMDDLVSRLVSFEPNLKHLSAYHQRIKTMPNGYSHYLKQLSDTAFLEEVEVK